MLKIMRVFRRRQARLRFSRETWGEMIAELGHRGSGAKESGAFLLARRGGDGRTIAAVVYYDDLDPHCLTGGITLHGHAYRALTAVCDDGGLRVVGDAHTHPSSWVGQSETDRENPMVARSGHLALIIPHFAQGSIRNQEVGVHEYLGTEGWQSWLGREAARLVYVGRWP